MTSSFSKAKEALGRKPPEIKTPEPTVYLVILNFEATKIGVSWTIRIQIPDDHDYVLEIVPKPKARCGYFVREERVPNAILKSGSFTTIKLGTIPTNGGWSQRALQSVLSFFKSYELDGSKPNGVSIIWVTDVLETLKRQGFLCTKDDVDAKIELQTRLFEKKLESGKFAGRCEVPRSNNLTLVH